MTGMRSDAPAYQHRCPHQCVRDNIEHAHFHAPELIGILRAHVPSITSEMDEDEDLYPRDDEGNYNGDQRVCRCGVLIDGYYEYVDHLAQQFGWASVHRKEAS